MDSGLKEIEESFFGAPSGEDTNMLLNFLLPPSFDSIYSNNNNNTNVNNNNINNIHSNIQPNNINNIDTINTTPATKVKPNRYIKFNIINL